MSPQVTSAFQFYCAVCNEMCSIRHSTKESHCNKIHQLTTVLNSKEIKPEMFLLPLNAQAALNETNYTCLKCNESIEYEHLSEHVTTLKHRTDVIALHCVVCRIILKTSNELIRHLNSNEHETGLKNQILLNRRSNNLCIEILALCDVPNKQRSFLYQTVVASLLGETIPSRWKKFPQDTFFCLFCEWSCQSESKLIAHLHSSTHLEKMSLDTNSSENDIFCCLCNQFCNSSVHKKPIKHAKIIRRLGENLPIEANIFQTTKIIPKIVNESEYLITDKTDDFIFTCSLCKLVLPGTSLLYLHIDSVTHNENVVSNSNLIFSQIFNLMIFQDRKNIEFAFIHGCKSKLTGIQDFVCSICRVRFTQNKRLQVHLMSKQHHEELENIRKTERLIVEDLKCEKQVEEINCIENLEPISTPQVNSTLEFYCSVCKEICDVGHSNVKSHLDKIPNSKEIKPEMVFLPLYAQTTLNETNYTCSKCDELIEDKVLYEHMTLKHKTKNIAIQCVVCQITLNTNHELIEHLISIEHRNAMKTQASEDEFPKTLYTEILASIDFPNTQYSFLYRTKNPFKGGKRKGIPGSTFFCIPCKWNSQNKKFLVNHLVSPEHTRRLSTSLNENSKENDEFCCLCNTFCHPSNHTGTMGHKAGLNRLGEICSTDDVVEIFKNTKLIPKIVNELEYSISDTTDEFVFTCSICKLVLQGTCALSIHLNAVSHIENFLKNTDLFFCQILNLMIFQDTKCIELGFIYGSCYESELKGIRHFVCLICGKKIRTIKGLQQHLISVTHYGQLNTLKTQNFSIQDLKTMSQQYYGELKKTTKLQKMQTDNIKDLKPISKQPCVEWFNTTKVQEIQFGSIKDFKSLLKQPSNSKEIQESQFGSIVDWKSLLKQPGEKLVQKKLTGGNHMIFCFTCKTFFSWQHMDEHERNFKHTDLDVNSPYIWKNKQTFSTDETYFCDNSIQVPNDLYFICHPCKSIIQGNKLFLQHLLIPEHVESYEKRIQGVMNSPSNELAIKISSLLTYEKDLEKFQERPFLYACISNLYLTRSTKEDKVCTICNQQTLKNPMNHLNSENHAINISKLQIKHVFCNVCATFFGKKTDHPNNGHHKFCISKLERMFDCLKKNTLTEELVYLNDPGSVLETIEQYKCYPCDTSHNKNEFIKHMESCKHRINVWKQFNDTAVLFTCSICRCYLPGVKTLASHCLSTNHIGQLAESLKSREPCIRVLNSVEFFTNESSMIEAPFLYAVGTNDYVCLNCNTYLSGADDLIADLTLHDQSNSTNKNLQVMQNQLCLSDDIIEDVKEELINCQGIKSPKFKINNLYFNIPYKKEYLQLEDEIFKFGVKNMKEFQLIDELLYWVVGEKKIVCIVCDVRFSDTALLCFKHIESAEHREKLYKFKEENCQDLGNELTLKHIIKCNEDEMKCYHCGIVIDSSERSVRGHLKLKNHRKKCKNYEKLVESFWEARLIEFQNIWYGIQRYACVPCEKRWAFKMDFIQHIYKEHILRPKVWSKRKELVYDFCISCTCLWLGYKNTLHEHCLNIMHQYFQQRKDFTIDEIPHTVPHLLKNFNRNADKLYELSETIDDEKQFEVVRCLKESLTPLIPDLTIHLYGSRVTGLGFPDSDLDIFIDCGDAYYGAKTVKNSVEQLEKIAEILSADEKTWEIMDLRKDARTPIINLRHLSLSVNCDICVINGLAVENSRLIKFFNDFYPPCRRLILFLKRWLALCGLPGPANIKNYSLYWLVIFYLQKKNILPSVADLKKNPASFINGWEVGIVTDYKSPTNSSSAQTFRELLLGFYQFYATFDFRYDVVCPLIGQELKKTDFTEPDKLPVELVQYLNKINSEDFEYFRVDSTMCIQDPFDLSDNPTKAVKPLTVKCFKQYCQESANILIRSSPSALKKKPLNTS